MTSPPSAPVPSPCTNVCRINEATGWCEGCGRTLGEIAAWSTMEDDEKRAVWALLPPRRERLEAVLQTGKAPRP
jgi:predicted Fe-S protein YdhL (DUF1289 family)